MRRNLDIAAVLLVALTLRVIGLHYGLPWLFYFHDEPQVVLRALRFGTGDFNPHFFGWPGILMFEVAFVSFIGLFVFGRVTGLWRDTAGYAAAYFRDPTAFYVLTRLQCVASGVWTVWIAFGLGAAAYSRAVGLGAAIALALSALHGHYSQFAHPVIVLTAFVSLGLWASVRLAVDGGGREMRIFALALGLGVAAQYHAVLLLAPFGTAIVLRMVAEPARRAWWARAGALAVLGGLAIFLILSPFTVLDHRQFLHDLAYEATKASGGPTGPPSPARALLTFYDQGLLPSFSWPVLWVAGLGSLLALVRRKAADLVLLSFVAIYFVVMSRSGLVNDRYGLPLLLPGVLFAARLVEEVASRVTSPRFRNWVTPVAMLALSLPSAQSLVEMDLTMRRGDTRIEAMRWFEAHVSAGERVVIDMQRYRNTASPPLNENAERLRERIDEVRNDVEASGSSRAYEPYYRYLLEHPRTPAYYLLSTDMGGEAKRLDEYVARGFRWAVTSSEARGFQEAAARAGDSTHVRYYLDLDQRATRVAEFRPERWKRLGPVIRVYRMPGH